MTEAAGIAIDVMAVAGREDLLAVAEIKILDMTEPRRLVISLRGSVMSQVVYCRPICSSFPLSSTSRSPSTVISSTSPRLLM